MNEWIVFDLLSSESGISHFVGHGTLNLDSWWRMPKLARVDPLVSLLYYPFVMDSSDSYMSVTPTDLIADRF